MLFNEIDHFLIGHLFWTRNEFVSCNLGNTPTKYVRLCAATFGDFHGTLKTLLITKIWVSLFLASNYILYFHWDRVITRADYLVVFFLWEICSLFEYGLKSQENESHLRRLDCHMLKLRSAIMIEIPRTFLQVVIQYFQVDEINPG